MTKKGKVYLVGAGPGDPGLMTMRGMELLKKAEVVVHDRLIGDDIIAMIPESAEKINVGKYAGNHPFPQDKINLTLLEKAKEGKQVVRLKGGDPFIFGRGGEELELLEQEGIEFEVVPGITAAVAVSAYAGIPVTHRDYCSSLHFITGHAQAGRELDIDFNALAELDGTLVFFMSVSTAGMIADGLIGAGLGEDMPTAIIENGTRSDQRTFVQPLSELKEAVIKHEIISPALIIVGRVCQLNRRFAWFEKLPLKGKHFLVTRPEAGSSRLAAGLRLLGAKATVRPAIKTEPIRPLVLPSADDADGAGADHGTAEGTAPGAGFDTVVFTSAAGVQSFCDWLLEEGMDMRWFAGRKVASIGSATSAALKGRGIAADFVPSIFSGRALGEEMISAGFIDQNSRVLLLRTDMASRDVTDILTRESVAFADVPVYSTTIIEYDEGGEPEDEFDVVTFTSKSCVDGYVGSLQHGGDGAAGAIDGERKPGAGQKALCIGEKTAAAAREQGFDVVVSEEATIESMLAKAVEMDI